MKTKLHQAALLSSITLVAAGLLAYLGMKARNETGRLTLTSATNKATLSLPVPATTDAPAESNALTHMQLGNREPVIQLAVGDRWGTFNPLPLQTAGLPALSTPLSRSHVNLPSSPTTVVPVSDASLDYDIAIPSARSRDKWMLLDRQRD